MCAMQISFRSTSVSCQGSIAKRKKINHYFRCFCQLQYVDKCFVEFSFWFSYLESAGIWGVGLFLDWNVKSPLRQFRYCLNINFSSFPFLGSLWQDDFLFIFHKSMKKKRKICQDLKRQFAILIRRGGEIFWC